MLHFLSAFSRTPVISIQCQDVIVLWHAYDLTHIYVKIHMN